MVRDDQWNPLVATSPSPWGESIFPPDVRCSIDLVLDKGGFIATMSEVGFQLRGSLPEIVIG